MTARKRIRRGDLGESTEARSPRLASTVMGTYGSRSLVVGGPALAKASDKVIAKGKKIAAHLLEASEQDIAFERGTFSVIGTDRKKTLADIALAAYVPPAIWHERQQRVRNTTVITILSAQDVKLALGKAESDLVE